MAKVTLKDVAAKAGVSYQTVSKVINGRGQVTDETEKRIWNAIGLLNYQPNVAARNLRTQASNLIGFAWAAQPYSAWQPILDQFMYSVLHEIEAQGYLMIFFSDREMEAYQDVSTFTELYGRNQVAGFIFAKTIPNDPRIQNLRQLNIPFVSFGRSGQDCGHCWVDVDGHHGIETMVLHLADMGHERIAYIGWDAGLQTGQHREVGYTQGMKLAALPFDPVWIERGLDDSKTGARGMSRFMSLASDRRPTAVVCASDLVAVGALNVAVEAGVQVGPEMAITGYDNVPMTELLKPPLTTVKQPITEVGCRVVDLLLKQIHNQPIAESGLLLKPELVIRESSLR